MVRTFAANVLFVLHLLVGAVILSGWAFPDIRVPYLVLLIGWPLCWVVLGYCPLTKWEFELRKINVGNKYSLNGEFTRHYLKQWFNLDVPTRPIFITGGVLFLTLLVLTLRSST